MLRIRTEGTFEDSLADYIRSYVIHLLIKRLERHLIKIYRIVAKLLYQLQLELRLCQAEKAKAELELTTLRAKL